MLSHNITGFPSIYIGGNLDDFEDGSGSIKTKRSAARFKSSEIEPFAAATATMIPRLFTSFTTGTKSASPATKIAMSNILVNKWGQDLISD